MPLLSVAADASAEAVLGAGVVAPLPEEGSDDVGGQAGAEALVYFIPFREATNEAWALAGVAGFSELQDALGRPFDRAFDHLGPLGRERILVGIRGRLPLLGVVCNLYY